MQSLKPEKKPKINRLTLELVVMAALFFGFIVGVQALQGGASRPQYDPLAVLLGPVRFLQFLRSR